MTEEQQVRQTWARIERWLQTHAPEMLAHLQGPASPEALADAERQLGTPLPAALRTSYEIHNGDGQQPGALPDWHWFLPVEEAILHWGYQKDMTLPHERDLVENGPAWRDQVESSTIVLEGPVKPVLGSPHWIPITTMNGDIWRYIDLDPAPGGTQGQVIEVDLEGLTWRVLAPSFLVFMQSYADDLERGVYTITEDGLESTTTPPTVSLPVPLPAYLQNVTIERYVPGAYPLPPALSTVGPDDEVILVGEMNQLIGGTEKIFTLITEEGQEHGILATPAVTTGYSAIRVRQHARVRVKRYQGQPASELQQFHPEPAIQWLALEYTLLR